MALSSDNRYVATGAYDKSMKVLDLESKHEICYMRDCMDGMIF